ncbi:hypothetical protein D043_1732A, partial [Vibrio parahaemolyticus EKP-021]
MLRVTCSSSTIR